MLPILRRRRLFLERLEDRFALDADGFDDTSLSDPPPDPPPDPPADVQADSPSDTSDPSTSDPSTSDPSTSDPSTSDQPTNETPANPSPAPTDPSDPTPDPTQSDPSQPSDPPPDPNAETPPDPNAPVVGPVAPVPPPDPCDTPSGCIGAPPPYDPSNPPPPIAQSPGEEMTMMANILEAAIRDWQDKMDRDLGQGWVGNVTGWGYTCDVVHDFLQARMSAYQTQLEHAGFVFDDYTFASAFSGGYVSYIGGALTEHIYMGIVDKNTGDMIAFADPWRSYRYAQMLPDELDPNTGSLLLTPWNPLNPYVPPPYNGPPQDPITGEPPGDQGGGWTIP